MSILTQLIEGKITAAQAEQDVVAWGVSIGQNLEKTVQSDPGVQSAVTALSANAQTGLAALESWSGTAISGILASAVSEGETLVAKYVTQLVGTGSPVTAAEVTVVQALGQVLQSAVTATVSSALAAKTPTA